MTETYETRIYRVFYQLTPRNKYHHLRTIHNAFLQKHEGPRSISKLITSRLKVMFNQGKIDIDPRNPYRYRLSNQALNKVPKIGTKGMVESDFVHVLKTIKFRERKPAERIETAVRGRKSARQEIKSREAKAKAKKKGKVTVSKNAKELAEAVLKRSAARKTQKKPVSKKKPTQQQAPPSPAPTPTKRLRQPAEKGKKEKEKEKEKKAKEKAVSAPKRRVPTRSVPKTTTKKTTPKRKAKPKAPATSDSEITDAGPRVTKRKPKSVGRKRKRDEEAEAEAEKATEEEEGPSLPKIKRPRVAKDKTQKPKSISASSTKKELLDAYQSIQTERDGLLQQVDKLGEELDVLKRRSEHGEEQRYEQVEEVTPFVEDITSPAPPSPVSRTEQPRFMEEVPSSLPEPTLPPRHSLESQLEAKESMLKAKQSVIEDLESRIRDLTESLRVKSVRLEELEEKSFVTPVEGVSENFGTGEEIVPPAPEPGVAEMEESGDQEVSAMIQKPRQEWEALHQKIAELQDETVRLQQTVSELQAAAMTTNAPEPTSIETLAESTANILEEEMTTMLENESRQFGQYTEQVESFISREREKFIKEVEESGHRILEKEQERLNAIIEEMKVGHDTLVKSLRNEIDELSSRCNSLEADKNDLEAKNVRLETRLEDVSEVSRRDKESLELANERNKALEEDVEKLRVEENELKNALSRLEVSLQESMALVEKIERRAKEVETNLESMQRRHDDEMKTAQGEMEERHRKEMDALKESQLREGEKTTVELTSLQKSIKTLVQQSTDFAQQVISTVDTDKGPSENYLKEMKELLGKLEEVNGHWADLRMAAEHLHEQQAKMMGDVAVVEEREE